jgi:hypothetical protein
VIEAIVENAEVKRKVFAQAEPRMKETAILASNTSSIPLQDLASVLKRPERLVGIHFFNPVAQMMLVEIVRGPQTSDEVMQAAQTFTRAIDKLPLPCKSAPGFLVNRVLSPYLSRRCSCRRGRAGRDDRRRDEGFRHADGADRARRHGGPRHRLGGGPGARQARLADPEEAAGAGGVEELRHEDRQGLLHVGEGQAAEIGRRDRHARL